MAKPFSQLRTGLSDVRRQSNREAAEQMMAELPLNELRKARQLSQETLADTLKVQQSAISRMERRTDMYLSTLRSYVEAMGGQLVLQAEFPDGTVRITQLEDLDRMSSKGRGD